MKRLLAHVDGYAAALLLTVLLASILPAHGLGATIVDGAAQSAIVLLFFLHGAKLSTEMIVQGLLHWRLHVTVLCFTYVVFPIVGLCAYALAAPILLPDFARGLLFLALLPSTVQSSIAFTAMDGGNVAAAICTASASNLLGVVLTPALVALLMHGSSGSVSQAGAQTIVLQLLLPFIAGHLSRPLIGRFVGRHKALVGSIDRGSILLIVYSAFSAAVVEGLWHKAPFWQVGILVLFCAVMLVIILSFTRLSAKLLGFQAPDETTIMFCGSKKSLASGVPIAGALFPAASVGAIILPLMIFHQVQLLVCAAIAQRIRRRDARREVAAAAA